MREEADMKIYEAPVMICRTFNRENILTASKTDAQVVQEQLAKTVSVNMQTVKWDNMK